jgi:hypothetical protein
MIPEPEIAVAEAGYSLWRYFRPWLHLRIALRGARNRRRARRGLPLLPPLDAEVPAMDETKLTIIRTVLKIGGTVLVAHGVMSAADATAFQVAAEAIFGGLATLVGIYWSHRTAVVADAAK